MIASLLADITPRARLGLLVVAALLLAAPAVLDRYLLSVLVLVFFSAYVGQAWNVMMGFAGLLSLGHALYVGLGAYVAAGLWVNLGISPLIGVFPAVAVAVAFGAAIAWLGFRFRIEGVYFALLTIAFAEATRIGFDHISWTGAAAGFFIRVSTDTAQWWNLRGGPLFFYYLALGMAVAALIACSALRRSALGHRWLAVREDAEAARAIGIDVMRTRLSAVLVSSGMTALAGVFYAFYYSSLFPGQIFDMSRSIDIMLAPIVGGIGTLVGPILGAFILVPLGEILLAATRAVGLDAPGTKAVFFGLALMVVITLAPGGIWPWLRDRLALAKEER